ncbi:hypothetical protein LOZ39_004689 [Ophidiomyces ophidiicola]|nr:hypothetical protein LOZ64_004138 [Ophidiomyces ophidiicola]KAI2013384.1 hypothetical protein LOZ49_002164 [Ophidiomyces ophidiicola]KAI2038829.1 hypothetical protein LOZ47_002873 [Ophidiomyces ophidiicola]KAI2054198.1 hypothetical protein LOZ44_002471 [Ophidiomyces ophidiicola]KAI2071219.1 hypothetical protein LOZ39_004689 [Ophidiomyces ophidiicola]
MHFSTALQFGLLALTSLPLSLAATTWGFADATLSVQQKGAGIGSGIKEKLSDKRPLSTPVSFGHTGTLKLLLTAQEGRAAKKPQQAFLLLTDPASNLDISYPLTIKENGKAKLELTHKDLPVQFLNSEAPLNANLVIASFGSAQGYNSPVFRLSIGRDADQPLPSSEAVRYGKLPEIHHIFKADPTSPPVIISLVFVGAVLATLPVLGGLWLSLGVNLDHLSIALKSSPVSHILFVGSIFSLEAVFFMYYTSWKLFQTLPVALAVGAVAIFSGSRALGEVQERRLAGVR